MAVNPGHRRRRGRRRRRNPGLPGLGGITAEIKAGLPRLAGKLAVAAAIKYVKASNVMGGPSSIAGEPWGWQQYAVAAGVAMFAPKLLGRFINPTEFRRGAIDLMLTKALWTGVISKSAKAQELFGEIADGTQIYDSDGQGYLYDNGRAHAMQGLVTSGPMDGLVTGGPMDGFLPSNTPREESIKSAYRGTGSSDPYAY